MASEEKECKMKTSVSKTSLDFPEQPKPKSLPETYVQAWVPDRYWIPVSQDLLKRKIKIKEFLELCVKLYIMKYLPDTAKKLGLK